LPFNRLLNLGHFFSILAHVSVQTDKAMLLIFPSIEISHENCVEVVQGAPGAERKYSIDPVKMAVLWRGENAKTLHVVDVDGFVEGKVVNRGLLRNMVQAVDIPIQIGGGFRSFEQVQEALELGVYRVIIGTAAVEQPGLIERLVKVFGTRKIAIAILTRDGKVMIEGGKREAHISALDLTKQMKKLGVSRILYGNWGDQGFDSAPPLGTLKELASTNVRITSMGGARDFKDLLQLQELEKFGVDSVVIGKPLYENRFPCQGLWRLNERELNDLGPTRRM
jgi:phosphoribosylformimino-5-aminoimidazole carboxamide ribotide isomerase